MSRLSSKVTTSQSSPVTQADALYEQPAGNAAAAEDYGRVDYCDQKVSIADDLCYSSQEMCDIAAMFPDNEEFAESCAEATTTCEQATAKAEVCGATVGDP